VTHKNLDHIVIEAPGRICLFGDHQDYLQLPVIACAINRHIVLSARKNQSDYFQISMPDISTERRISISESFEVLEPKDHLASVLRTVRRYGCIPKCGYDIQFKSNIPINAGVSSSSALVVAWVHFLLTAFGCYKELTPELIAQLAYEAEVLEHNSPGGRMDQYTIAIGNIIYIDTSKDLHYNTIGTAMDGLILADSGIPKDTIGLLSHVKTNAITAIDFIKKRRPNFDVKSATMVDFENFSNDIPKELIAYFYAAIKNHSITKKAMNAFKEQKLNLELIGQLINEHHHILKTFLKITVPKIDDMIDAAMNVGAFGAKIVGSGGGGTIMVLSPPDKKQLIIQKLLQCGAKSAYEVSVTKGSKRQ